MSVKVERFRLIRAKCLVFIPSVISQGSIVNEGKEQTIAIYDNNGRF